MKPSTTKSRSQSIPCPSCHNGFLKACTRDFDTKTDGTSYTIPDVAMRCCDQCGEPLLTPAGSRQVDAFLDRATGTITSEEILLFLERYDLTHKKAAEILGIGEKNISRWLNGRQRASASMSSYIRVLIAHPAAFETLRKKQWQFPVGV